MTNTDTFIAGQEGSYFISSDRTTEERNRLWNLLIEIVNLDDARKFIDLIDADHEVSRDGERADLYRAVRHLLGEPRLHPGDELIRVQNIMPALFTVIGRAITQDRDRFVAFRKFVRTNTVSPRDFVQLAVTAHHVEAA